MSDLLEQLALKAATRTAKKAMGGYESESSAKSRSRSSSRSSHSGIREKFSRAFSRRKKEDAGNDGSAKTKKPKDMRIQMESDSETDDQIRKRDKLKEKLKSLGHRSRSESVMSADTATSLSSSSSSTDVEPGGKRRSRSVENKAAKKTKKKAELHKKRALSFASGASATSAFEDTETAVSSSDGEGGRSSDGIFSSGSSKSSKSKTMKAARPLTDVRSDDDAFDDLNARHNFCIRVRVIEAKELQGTTDLHPLCRVFLAGKSRTTRTRRSTDAPKWNQSLNFSLKRTGQQLCQTNLEFRVYSACRVIKDSLIGSFQCNLGIIHKQPQHSIVEKWLALTRASDDDGGHINADVCGFLKVSVSVFRAGQSPPTLTTLRKGAQAGDCDEDVLFGAQFRHYSLQLRIFELTELCDSVRALNDTKLAVEVAVGRHSLQTAWATAAEHVSIGQELNLPIMWPTVIKQVRLRLLSDNDRRPLATMFLTLRDLCRSGDEGFLPTFGPAYLTWFGPDREAGWSRREMRHIAEGRHQGTWFYGRMLLEVNCVAHALAKPQLNVIPSSVAQAAQIFRHRVSYTLFCCFFAGNAIHKDFRSKNISFDVSLGHYGNPAFHEVPPSTSRTLAVMPGYDSKRYFTMPWGSHKPVCEVPCAWEDVGRRMEEHNNLTSIADLLDRYADEAQLKGGSGDPDEDELSSIVMEALDRASDRLLRTRAARFRVRNADSPKVSSPIRSDVKLIETDLDRHLTKVRADQRIKLSKAIEEFQYERFTVQMLAEVGVRQLRIVSRELRKLAVDPQMSIPDVVVQMLENGKMVGYERIPAARIFYSIDRHRRGGSCGHVTPFLMQWPNRRLHQSHQHAIPALLHLRLWFGRTEDAVKWRRVLEPARLRYYAELFFNMERRMLHAGWKETTINPFPISDETGAIKLNEETVQPPTGWKFNREWKQIRSHDMYVSEDAGYTTYEDELFEQQIRREQDGQWVADKFTGYYGDVVEDGLKVKPPTGWSYPRPWTVDLHCAGDPEGWVYSVTENFWGHPAAVDIDERQDHQFRRRRYVNRRVLKENDTTTVEMDDDELKCLLGSTEGWEYASRFGQPVHLIQMPNDLFRRRRMLREIVPAEVSSDSNRKLAMRIMGNRRRPPSQELSVDDPTKFCWETESSSLSPRIYAVHESVGRWQLRAYILWARDLLPSARLGSRAFVRVVFMNRCLETLVIENAINPIWNETLLFEKLLLPGGLRSLSNHPPSLMIEVCADDQNDSQRFLGRFLTKPIVISETRKPTNLAPRWHALHFGENKTRGALLAQFELYQADDKHLQLLPPRPKTKPQFSKRFEVPENVRPQLQLADIQLLCWGVRSLSRYQLLPVRSPFVEVIVADHQQLTEPIADVNINPNFDSPLLTLTGVQLPVKLHYAPPITINLYDKRSFGRRPLIGVCHVKEFGKYKLNPSAKATDQLEDGWKEFDTRLKSQEEYLHQLVAHIDINEGVRGTVNRAEMNVNNPELDWWSKYYASVGDERRATGVKEIGIDELTVFDQALEDVCDYRGFGDFCQTFEFRKVTKGNFDDPEQQDFRGELKGRLCVYMRTPEMNDLPSPALMKRPPGVEFTGAISCVVRVYIVRAFDLASRRRSGVCDSYVEVRCGKNQKKSRKKEYKSDAHNPIYGQLFEFSVTLPQEKDLKVIVKDRRRILADEEIGTTTIDLENRLLTKFRATVGLSKQYTIGGGPVAWRDQLSPLHILKRYCKKHQIPAPTISVQNESIELLGHTFVASQFEKEPPKCKNLGPPLQRIALYILRKGGLVPEHVETRPLYNSINPDMECGRLQMFVDIFPREIGPIPPPLNIEPRKPHPFQLRVVIWNVRDVLLEKRNFGVNAADIYVKCFINGMDKAQKTDVHYRSLDGSGSFNWRMVFNFDYNPWEKMITVYRRRRWFRRKIEEDVEPELVVQIWDNNKFNEDHYIGQMRLKLLALEEGQLDESDMLNVQGGYKERPCLWRCFTCCCNEKRCCCNKKRQLNAIARAPRYIPNVVRTHSLFEQRTVRGWWPTIRGEVPVGGQSDAAHKKNDDIGPEAQNLIVSGKVELEMALLPAAEADKDPVGKKRRKPNHSPHLSKPDRPRWDSHWCTSRMKGCGRIFWKRAWWKLLIAIIIIVMIAILVISFVWRFPDLIYGMGGFKK